MSRRVAVHLRKRSDPRLWIAVTLHEVPAAGYDGYRFRSDDVLDVEYDDSRTQPLPLAAWKAAFTSGAMWGYRTLDIRAASRGVEGLSVKGLCDRDPTSLAAAAGAAVRFLNGYSPVADPENVGEWEVVDAHELPPDQPNREG